jgi:hypothetical protein
MYIYQIEVLVVFWHNSAREPACSWSAPKLQPKSVSFSSSSYSASHPRQPSRHPPASPRSFKWPWLSYIHAWTWIVGMAKGQWMPRLWLWATRSSFCAIFNLIFCSCSSLAFGSSLQRGWQDQPVTPVYTGQI